MKSQYTYKSFEKKSTLKNESFILLYLFVKYKINHNDSTNILNYHLILELYLLIIITQHLLLYIFPKPSRLIPPHFALEISCDLLVVFHMEYLKCIYFLNY